MAELTDRSRIRPADNALAAARFARQVPYWEQPPGFGRIGNELLSQLPLPDDIPGFLNLIAHIGAGYPNDPQGASSILPGMLQQAQNHPLGTALGLAGLPPAVHALPMLPEWIPPPAMLVYHGTPHTFPPVPPSMELFHGHPGSPLETILANPLTRQYDNASSQFGAFFAPTEAAASPFAGRGGTVQKVNVHLRNPYEMPWSEFMQYQNIRPTSIEDMARQTAELKAAAIARKAELERAGYDGIVVRSSRGGKPTGPVLEVASFRDVPANAPPNPGNPLGEFDLSKIGTGEGAQAYGHGIYLAESPGVARNYYEVLGGHNNWRMPSGVEFPNWIGRSIAQQEGRARQIVVDELLRDFKNRIVETRKAGRMTEPQYWNERGKVSNLVRIVRGLREAAGGINPEPVGGVLRVDLPDEQIARMLDWDAPLRQQPNMSRLIPLLQSSIAHGDELARAAGIRPAPMPDLGNMLGEQAYGYLSQLAPRLGNPPRSAGSAGFYASQALNNLGIPGLKYLDQGSRAAGQGTRNFVVWQPDILRILGRE